MIISNEDKIKKVIMYFTWLESYISVNNSFCFTDINISLETLMLKILNVVFNNKYENCNFIKNNYPYIDLIDKKNKIGIQITSETNAKKIKKTYRNILNIKTKIFVLSSSYKPNKKSYMDLKNFNFKKDFITIKTLIAKIKSDEIILLKVLEILENNIIIPLPQNILDNLGSGYNSFFNETIIKKIKNTCTNFVPTEIAHKCLKHLETKNVLVLIGEPGIGKSYTSEFVLSRYINNGYKLLFSPNKNMIDIMNSYKKGEKAIIYIDDIFGSNNIDFMKNLTDIEIESLLTNTTNNLKIVINSRTSYFKDVNEKYDKIQRISLQPFIIEATSFSYSDKARILIKHLINSNIPKAEINKLFSNSTTRYLLNGMKNQNIYLIIYHTSFNPRLIEFITKSENFMGHGDYIKFIFENLDNPKEIYNHAYNNNLNDEDRTILKGIYLKTSSKNNNGVSIKDLFKNIKKLGISEDKFNISINKLEQSFISIYNISGNKMCRFYNPSIMDFCINKFSNSSDLNTFIELTDDPNDLDNIIENNQIDFSLKRKKILELNYTDSSKIIKLINYSHNDIEFQNHIKKMLLDTDKNYVSYEEDKLFKLDFMSNEELLTFFQSTNYISSYISITEYGLHNNSTEIIVKNYFHFSEDRKNEIINCIIEDINKNIKSNLNDFISSQKNKEDCNKEVLLQTYEQIKLEIINKFKEDVEIIHKSLTNNIIEPVLPNIDKFQYSDYEEFIDSTFEDNDYNKEPSVDEKEVINLVESFYKTINEI